MRANPERSCSSVASRESSDVGSAFAFHAREQSGGYCCCARSPQAASLALDGGGVPGYRRLAFVEGEWWAGPGVDGEPEDVGPVVVPYGIELTASGVDGVDIDVGGQDGLLVARRAGQ